MLSRWSTSVVNTHPYMTLSIAFRILHRIQFLHCNFYFLPFSGTYKKVPSFDGTTGSQISSHQAVKCELKPFTGTPFLACQHLNKKEGGYRGYLCKLPLTFVSTLTKMTAICSRDTSYSQLQYYWWTISNHLLLHASWDKRDNPAGLFSEWLH